MKLFCKKNNVDRTPLDDSWRVMTLENIDFGFDFYSFVSKCGLSDFITFVARDLLEISLFVYGADRTISRDKEGVDCWKREITLNIPVRELETWNKNKNLLINTLCFLSGDKWDITFRKFNFVLYPEIAKTKLVFDTDKYGKIDSICMLSGGLDSFIGAIDLLESGNKPIFVSIHSKGDTPSVQTNIQSVLSDHYSHGRENFMSFYVAVRSSVENSMRTRSFMFFAHAIALASSFNKDMNLFIPENGYISLNIPLSFSRIGSSSTRTTHPYYMGLLQTLLTNVGIKVNLNNPFTFYTKGEMIIQCKNQQLLTDSMCSTISCSHPDLGRYYENGSKKQCGYCYPCTVRRAAFFRAGLADSTPYMTDNYRLNNASRENLTSYNYAIKRKNHENPIFSVQRSGPLPNIKGLSDYASLYSRGIDEIADFLNALGI